MTGIELTTASVSATPAPAVTADPVAAAPTAPPAPTPPSSAAGDAEVVRLLDADGRRVTDPAHASYAERIAHLRDDDLRGMYRDMVMVRAFDLEATSLQRQGELGLWPPSLGQEAAQIGSGRALRQQDYVFPSYREHGVAHTRGLDLRRILHLYRGIDHGGWDPAETNYHLATLVIGAHALHAAGYAMGIQRDGDVGTGDPDRDRAVVAYFGDGATAQGDVNEALVFAATTNAPVVFFCQNNQWAISAPSTVQTRVPLGERGSGFGIPGVRVDGNDVLASYAVTAEALERARNGGGPTFIEAVTYRMGAHTTSDDPTRYRDHAEEDVWRGRDPIDRLRRLLEAEGLADQAFLAEVEAESTAFAADVREYCRALEKPGPATMFEHVYSAGHPLVAEERAWYAQYADSFETAGVAR